MANKTGISIRKALKRSGIIKAGGSNGFIEHNKKRQ
jgi:hypothetical protein